MKEKNNIPSFDFEKFQSKFISNADFTFDNKGGFKIFKIQEVLKYLKFPLPLHRTNYYDILFITKGEKSSKHCGLKKYEIFSGDIFFKAAGQVTSGEIYSKDMEGYFCLMDNDFISSNTNNNILLASFPFFKYGNHPIISVPVSALD
ncbi:MAG: hypothetical protein ABIQ31_09340, partial [Ferruginibacter sp.]